MIDFLERIAKPSKLGINQGLTTPTANFLFQEIGTPRDSFTGNCQDPNDAAFKRLVATKSVGPFRATGLKAALTSLTEVMGDVKVALPDLHDKLGSAGMLCCRLRHIGGKNVEPPSAHSWGTAIDLTIGGKLDPQGDNLTMRGLALLAKFFNAHGWVWGAAFPTEDSMHFELSREKIVSLRQQGLI